MTGLDGLLVLPGLLVGTVAVGLSRLDERRREWVVIRRLCLAVIAVQVGAFSLGSMKATAWWGPAALVGLALSSVVAVLGGLALRDALIPARTMMTDAIRPGLGAALAFGLAVLLGAPWSASWAWTSLGILLASWVPLPSRDEPEPARAGDGQTIHRTRETLLAVERLTDPVAVQRRVASELTKLFPGARLEVLRASTAPKGVLVGAKMADSGLLRAVTARGYAVRGRTRGLSVEQRRALEASGASLLLPVRGGYTLYGLLRLDHDRVDRPMIVTARRFADLLGLKLETHRLHEEVSFHRRLAELGTLASGLAHDLRTPLSTIQMNLQMLQLRQADLGSDAECVRTALSAVEHLDLHIATLLDYARPIDLHREVVHLIELARDAIAQVEALRAERKVDIALQSADALPTLTADPMRLSRVLVNLLENALRASDPQTSIDVAVLHHSAGVQIVVRDQGHGIPADDLPKLFDPFFTTRSDGTGLGLAMCKKIVEAHGGTIWARNRGIGAEFRVELPVR